MEFAGSFFGTIILLVIGIMAIILAVLWIYLPFLVFSIDRKLHRPNLEIREMRSDITDLKKLLKSIEGEVSMQTDILGQVHDMDIQR